jgi:inorganic pyrophosphatase
MNILKIVVETPKGSTQKYDYNPDTNFFELNKVLPASMVFPFDFGFIPGTKGQDGDPLDVVVISESGNFPGCMIQVRIIGVIEAEQGETGAAKTYRNDRYLAVPQVSVVFSEVNDLKDLPKKLMEELENFFTQYNLLSGKKFKVVKHSGANAAMKTIKRNQERKIV